MGSPAMRVTVTTPPGTSLALGSRAPDHRSHQGRGWFRSVREDAPSTSNRLIARIQGTAVTPRGSFATCLWRRSSRSWRGGRSPPRAVAAGTAGR